jgi:hypothetical protein
VQEAGRFLAVAVGVDLGEGPGLVATRTLVFWFAGLGGPAAATGRLADAYAGVAAGDRRLIRAGLAARGG